MPDELLRCRAMASESLFVADLELGGELAQAFTSEAPLVWPHDLLRLFWETPLVVLPCLRFALKSALLARLARCCREMEELRLVPFVVTQQSFLAALAGSWTDPIDVLREADPSSPPRPNMSSGECNGIALFVDGWVGDLAPLRSFLSQHAVHVAVQSERYKTVAKAGIGADESSKDPPMPRFLGHDVNDTFSVAAGKVPLSFLAVSCDPCAFHVHKMWRFFAPFALHMPSPVQCSQLVRSMGSDAPSAAMAPDAWIAFLCGAAASIPPPVDSNPSAMRRLLTSLTGALHHLCTRLNMGRHVLLGAGFLATCSLSSLSCDHLDPARNAPLSEEDILRLCSTFVFCGGGGGLFKDGADMLETVCSAMKPFLSAAHPAKMLRYGHIMIDQWLAAQFLAVEDSVCDKVLHLASERFPLLRQVSGPASQTLPFVYSPRCAASAMWRRVLHFIGLLTGVYPLAYRLCAWGDNSNIASYQWLLQLKSQACSPMPKKSASSIRTSPALFEYDAHGDLGKNVFWMLCRVQAEVSVSYPSQSTDHGEENPFPHFVRAVIANPKHAYDLASVVVDPIFPPALSRLPDGVSIASHLCDLAVEAGCARPWAVNYYASILASLDCAGLLPLGFASHQCKALASSKSTSKRLLAAAFLREHAANLSVSVAAVGAETGSAATEFYSVVESLLLGASDRSSYVREDCLATLKNMILGSSVDCRNSVEMQVLLEESLNGLVSMTRDFMSAAGSSTAAGSGSGASAGVVGATPALPVPASGDKAPQARALSSLLIAGSNLLLRSSPFAIVPFLLARRSSDLSLASALVFALRRVSDMAQLEPVGESRFLWRIFAITLVPGSACRDFVPSDDLLFAVQEMGLVQTSLLRLSLKRLIASRPLQTVAQSLRWSERLMRLEVVRASLCCTQGPDILCRLLEEKQQTSETEEVLVTGMCAVDGAGSRKTKHMIRAAVACKSRPSLLVEILSTIKSDLDQRGWWRRTLDSGMVEDLLDVCNAAHSLSIVREVLGIFLACRCVVPAALIARVIIEAANADSASDSALHNMRLVLCQVQAICMSGTMLDKGFQDVSSIVTAVANVSPLVHPSLLHGVQVGAVRFLSFLPNREDVSLCCYNVIAGGGSGFVNGAVAMSLCCTVLSHCAGGLTAPPSGFDIVVLLRDREKVSSVATPLLGLLRELVRHKHFPAGTALSIVLPMILDGEHAFCALQREAALSVARVATLVAPSEVAWVEAVMEEIRLREVAIRAEEPGVVAGLSLVKFALKTADERDEPAPRPAVAAVGVFDGVIVSVLERSGKNGGVAVTSGGSGGGGGPLSPGGGSGKEDVHGWNLTVSGHAVGIIQHLIAIEARFMAGQVEQLNGSHLSRYALPLAVILFDSSSSADLRKTVMRAFRGLPRNALVTGLAQLALRLSKGSSKWGGMFAKKLSKSRTEDLSEHAEGVTMVDFMAPVYKAFDRTAHVSEKMLMLEVMAIVTLPQGEEHVPASLVTRTQTVFCDFLKTATSAMSTELSSIVAKHTQLFLPYIWNMLATSIKTSKPVATKWLTFLRKHTDSKHVQLPSANEIAASVKCFAVSQHSTDSAFAYKLFGVVAETLFCVGGPLPVAGSASLSSLVKFADLCTACDGLVNAMLLEAGVSESKETALISSLFLLGQHAAANGQTTAFYDSYRSLLDNLPYGLGRHCWRLLTAATGHLLF